MNILIGNRIFSIGVTQYLRKQNTINLHITEHIQRVNIILYYDQVIYPTENEQ